MAAKQKYDSLFSKNFIIKSLLIFVCWRYIAFYHVAHQFFLIMTIL